LGREFGLAAHFSFDCVVPLQESPIQRCRHTPGPQFSTVFLDFPPEGHHH
jgi:hypothetical protein